MALPAVKAALGGFAGFLLSLIGKIQFCQENIVCCRSGECDFK